MPNHQMTPTETLQYLELRRVNVERILQEITGLGKAVQINIHIYDHLMSDEQNVLLGEAASQMGWVERHSKNGTRWFNSSDDGNDTTLFVKDYDGHA